MRRLASARHVTSTLALLGLALLAAACDGGDGARSDAPPDGTRSADSAPSAEHPTRADALEVAGARSGYVDTPDGERIHYLEVGPAAGEAETDARERPSLLFIPGWMLPAEIWAPQLERFGATRRTVAMDPRAQGRSSKAREGLYAAARARDIRAVVEALELRPVVLVGWSMGVTEVAAYVEQFGTDGLAGIVLVDGLAGLDFEPELARQFLDWGAAYVHEREATTRAFVRSMFRTERSEDYLDALTERALMTPTDAAVALAVSQARSDHRAALRRIDRPTLIAIAPGGPWTPLYEAIADSIPGSRLERFEGAGHALFVDRAEEFNTRLEAFLADL